MSDTPSDNEIDAPPSFEDYGSSAPMNYQRYFVPVIGRPLARDLVEAAMLKEGDRVLDVACGTGVVARLAAGRVGTTGSVAGLDLNPGMLAVARDSTAPELGITWHEGSADASPFPADSFDVVLCQMGLQFFPDQPSALAEMRRVLAPGGMLALSVPGPTPELFEIMGDALARHVNPGLRKFVDVVFSIHDPRALQDLIGGAGFADISVRRYEKVLSLPAPAAFLWQYARSTPLAAAVAAADDESRSSLEKEVTDRWRKFLDDGSMQLKVGMLLATAH